MTLCTRPIVLIHGLWNNSNIFRSLTSELDKYNFEYFAPTLKHDLGMISIVELAKSLNNLILNKYGDNTDIDIIGFSMGGIIGRYWINKFNGYKRTKKFICVGSPHRGTLTAQFVPSSLLKGISEMKLNSYLLKELSGHDYLLENVECISFFTIWDLMVFPGWKAYLPKGKRYSLNIFKHRNLIRDSTAVRKIVEQLINTS